MQAKITKRTVDGAQPQASEWMLWDTVVRGFGCRISRHGGKTYVLKYRVAGRQRWLTIGRHGSPWTPDEAREEALRQLGRAKAGVDPAAEKSVERKDITLAELCDLYLKAAPTRPLKRSRRPKKASTLATDRGRIERHIKPLMGRLKVRAVTRSDIERFLHDVAVGKTASDVRTGPRGRAIVRGGQGTASRTVGLLGGILSYAVEMGLRAESPAIGVARYRDRHCERFLSSEELTALGNALAVAEKEGEHPSVIAGIRLLILTGARRSEILTLQWGHVDLEHHCLRLPDSKTGEKVIPIGTTAIGILSTLPRTEGNPYVLPGAKEGNFFVGLPKAWDRIRRQAGLQGVRLHDLRHSFASVGAAGGDSLLMIGALLGHRDPRTSQRYAHLGDDPLRRAADRISGLIDDALRGKGPSSRDP